MSPLYEFQEIDKKGIAKKTTFCIWGGRAMFDRKMAALKEGDRVKITRGPKQARLITFKFEKWK